MATVNVDGLEVKLLHTPDEAQLKYIHDVKRTLDARGVGLLEMPAATGKTSVVLATVLAYKAANGFPAKIVHVSQTVEASQRAMSELKLLITDASVFALNFSCKRNLCLNPQAKNAGSRLKSESKCIDLTASWLDRSCICPYYVKFRESNRQWNIPRGVYSMEDVKQLCELAGMCPFYVQKNYLTSADLVLCTYQYVFDPKLSVSLLEAVTNDSLIIFDDAGMIDQICIEMRSLSLNRETLNLAFNSMRALNDRFSTMKAGTDHMLQEDLSMSLLQLRHRYQDSNRDEMLMNPIISQDLLDETVPGNLRKANHFLSFLKRVLVFFRKQMKSRDYKINSAIGLLYLFKTTAFIDQESLKHLSSRLHSFLLAMRLTTLENYSQLISVCDLCTLIVTESRGSALILEPFPEGADNFDPVLQFTCLDAGEVFNSVLKRFSSSILTSHSLTPFEIYCKLLSITPVVTSSIDSSNSIKICPVILTRGSDQLAVSASTEDRDDDAIMRNYGDLLVELSDTVPDGIVCFFHSYKFMEEVVLKWNETGLLNRLLENKLVFFQSQDSAETNLAIYNFKLACDSGRGAILVLEVSTQLKFPGHYCRCVVVFGVPFQNTLSRFIKARINYLKDNRSLDERDFLNFDSMRQASHCISTALSLHNDYAVLVLADKRFAQTEKRDRLPGWIRKAIQPRYANLSTDMLVSIAKNFLQTVGD